MVILKSHTSFISHVIFGNTACQEGLFEEQYLFYSHIVFRNVARHEGHIILKSNTCLLAMSYSGTLPVRKVILISHTCFIAMSYSGTLRGRKPGSVVLAWNRQNHMITLRNMNSTCTSCRSYHVYGRHWNDSKNTFRVQGKIQQDQSDQKHTCTAKTRRLKTRTSGCKSAKSVDKSSNFILIGKNGNLQKQNLLNLRTLLQ